MSETVSGNKRIAKNTFFLYFRMFLVMAISLYTSRINLKALGIIDYGLYNLICGIVGFMTFINSALGTSSARYLTISLCKNNLIQSKLYFNTIYKVHLFIGIIVVILAETCGLFVVNQLLTIPDSRIFAVNIIYQCVILSVAINMSLVPLNASIVAHERFTIFAYIGIAEVVLKLLLSYALYYYPYDKLIFWGIANPVVTLGMYTFYFFILQISFSRILYLRKTKQTISQRNPRIFLMEYHWLIVNCYEKYGG